MSNLGALVMKKNAADKLIDHVQRIEAKHYVAYGKLLRRYWREADQRLCRERARRIAQRDR